MASQTVPLEFLKIKEGVEPKYIARCVLVTNKSLLPSEDPDKNDVT